MADIVMGMMASPPPIVYLTLNSLNDWGVFNTKDYMKYAMDPESAILTVERAYYNMMEDGLREWDERIINNVIRMLDFYGKPMESRLLNNQYLGFLHGKNI